MSKQTGLLRLKGTIGGVTFYKSEGEDLARLANGPDKERIDNDPAFQRTRENNMEFGGSAVASKALRTALATALQSVADSRLTSRLMQLFKKINTKGTGTRGQRSIPLSDNKTMLVNLEFNRKANFSSVFNAPFSASNTADRNEATLTVPVFNPRDYIKAPGGATHFRLTHAIGVVSDFVYNDDSKAYEPLEPALNGLNAVVYSAYTPLASPTSAVITLNAVLPGAPVMEPEVSVVECVGIEFYQQLAGINYLLAQGNAMKVAAVF